MSQAIRASDQLTLVASTLAHVQAELDAPQEFPALLGAAVPADWPTGEYDADAIAYFRDRLNEGGPEVEGWYGWYAIREADAESPRLLIGAAGYFGPPDAGGTVEIGYSVVPRWQGRGHASQMVRALVRHAYGTGRVQRVIAHTSAKNPASVAVLRRSGFDAVGAGEQADTFRFEHQRSATAGS
jgi:ribosomal-protein-alanine N-acetyltransferase